MLRILEACVLKMFCPHLHEEFYELDLDQGFSLVNYMIFSYRYFTKQQLHELFVLNNPRVSETQQHLAEIHTDQRKTDTWLDGHIAFLHTLGKFLCIIS